MEEHLLGMNVRDSLLEMLRHDTKVITSNQVFRLCWQSQCIEIYNKRTGVKTYVPVDTFIKKYAYERFNTYGS